MRKLLTVVVPSYNMETYLRGCLDSLLVPGDCLNKLEVIVVNDGSRDATSAIAHEYADRYPGSFRVIDKPNGNYGSCINAALPSARGEFIKVLDADDSVDTDAFADFLRFMETTISEHVGFGIDLFLADFDFVDPKGRITKTIRYAKDLSTVFSLDHLSISDIANIWTHAVAYRTEILRGMSYRQTEGVSYSDNDWTFYPMSRVRTVAHFARPVNRYLVGRPGQTVESGTFLRRFDTILNLIRNSARYFADDDTGRTSEGRFFLQTLLRIRLFEVYRVLLISHSNLFAESVRLAFDRDISTIVPEMAAEMAEMRASTRFSFCPVKEWRATGRTDSLPFRLYRFYKWGADRFHALDQILSAKIGRGK